MLIYISILIVVIILSLCYILIEMSYLENVLLHLFIIAPAILSSIMRRSLIISLSILSYLVELMLFSSQAMNSIINFYYKDLSSIDSKIIFSTRALLIHYFKTDFTIFTTFSYHLSKAPKIWYFLSFF